MLRGTLPLKYCTSRFAHKVPTWSLPFPGGVALLVGGMLVSSDPSSPDCGRIGDRSGVSGVNLLGIILVHGFGRD